MQLIEVPAKTGYVWFRQGIWLFRKNPLAFLTLFFTFLLVIYIGFLVPLMLDQLAEFRGTVGVLQSLVEGGNG